VRMPGFGRLISGASALAVATMILGAAAAMPAAAAPPQAGSHAAATRAAAAAPDEIVGVYKTYSRCNAAGAKGIRENKWIRYDCSEIHGLWYLSVERGEDVTSRSEYSDKATLSGPPRVRHASRLCAWPT
jgi:hypothetical protein